MTRQCRACAVHAIVGLVLCVFPLVISAQRQVAVQSLRDTAVIRGEERLNTPVTVNVNNVSRRQAVEAVARSANVFIQYRDRLLDKYSDRITIHVKDIPLRTALEQVLNGTSLRVMIDGGTRFVIVEDSARATATEKGTVVGRVIDSASGKAIVGAMVIIVGTRLSATTDNNGSFTIANVPVGTHGISARILGYTSKTASVTVNSGRTTSFSLALVQHSTTLTSVVTTATGLQRSYEVGNDITRINVDEVRKYNDITSVADLLANRVPGMFLQSGGGDAGAGDKIRIRGVHSITLSNDPILIVDGVRYETIGQNTVEGRATPVSLSSRLNDIDPASIETIEVFKGPSAATLYGPDAVNGVIVITRKRGRADETRWTVNANTRLSGIPRKFPGVMTDWGRSFESNEPQPCSSGGIMNGSCLGGDSITTYSLLNDERFTTMGRGHDHDLGMSMQTGSNQIQFSFNLRASDVLGPAKLSQAGVERLELLKGRVPSWARRPNAQQQLSGDARVTLQSVPYFDVGLQASLTHRNLRNSGNGIGSATNKNHDSTGVLPEQEFLNRKTELGDNSTASISVSTRQWSRFNWTGTFGISHGKTLRDDWRRAEDCLTADCSNAKGTRMKSTQATAGYTINSHLGVMTDVLSWGKLRSSIGLNSFRTNSDFFSITGEGMPLGVSNPSVAPFYSGVTQATQTATAGVYIREQLQVRDRFFVNGAIRRDVGSNLGQSAKTPTFPSVDLSWIASTNPFDIPWIGTLNTVRLRAAHGQSGQQPQTSQLYAAINLGSAFHDGSSRTAYFYNSLGNSYIKPERSSELEFGVDLELRGLIESLNLTYFHTITNDALISNILALESGFPDRSQTKNIGKLRNTGVEATTSLRLIDNAATTWGVNATFSQIRNIVLSLGSYRDFRAGTVATRVVEGYPLGGYWVKPVFGYDDRDGDGVLASNEYIIGDSMVYAGWDQPKYTMAYSSYISFFRGKVRLTSSLSQTIGMAKFTPPNNFIRPGGIAGDLDGQLRQRMSTNGLQTVSSLAWNAADVTMQLPPFVFQRLHARAGTFSISTTNLYLWTNYRGNDPNVGPLVGSDGGTTPQVRTWTLRCSLNY